MRGGTKSLLFGVHQIIIHPITVFLGWMCAYGKLPRPHQLLAIVIHDWGLWGMPDVDGNKAETHPRVVYDVCIKIADWGQRSPIWYSFWKDAALEVIGHSRFYAKRFEVPISKLYRADKLAINFYPMALYLVLGTLSGEINEYMERRYGSGKYSKEAVQSEDAISKVSWFLEARAHMSLLGLRNSVEV